jgi:hypothetical protein
MRVDTSKVRDKPMRNRRVFEYTRRKSGLSTIRFEGTNASHGYFAASRNPRGVTHVTDLNICVKLLWL